VTDDAVLEFALFSARGREAYQLGAFTQTIPKALARRENVVQLRERRSVKVTFDCLFPVVATPPELSGCLRDDNIPPPLNHDMHPEILPYLAEARLKPDFLRGADFAKVIFPLAQPPKSL
jgi:hypothetical protein